MSVATLIGAVHLVPSSTPPARPGHNFDIIGAITVTSAMLLLVFIVVEAPTAGWASLRTVGSFVATAGILAAFVTIERTASSPLVRLDVLRSGSLVRANVGAVSLLGAWIGCLFISTL
jgi:hypothetical protein